MVGLRLLPRRLLAVALAAAMVGPVASTRAQEPPAPPAGPAPAVPTGSAELEGQILKTDGKTPVPGAVVRACYLESEKLVESKPSDRKGEYHLDSLSQGYVDVTVESADGLFVANQVLLLMPGQRHAVDFVLTGYDERTPAWWSGQAKRESSCGGRTPTGSAEVRNRLTGGQWAKSTKGITVIAASAGVVLLLLASGGGGDEESASPF